MPCGNVPTVPGARLARDVLRQKRSFPSAAGTVIASFASWTMNMVPLISFSGRPPSDGGLKRGSRQVPVHSGLGSVLAPSSVSL